MYVDQMNKSNSKVNLVDLKCSKSVLRLLPQRPRSGDMRRRDERGPMNLDQGPKERERPGSLTLRAFPPDVRNVERRGYEQRQGVDKQMKSWRGDLNTKPDNPLNRSQTDMQANRSQTDMLTASSKTITSGTNLPVSSKSKTANARAKQPNSRAQGQTSRSSFSKSQQYTSQFSLARSQSYGSRIRLSNAYRPREPTTRQASRPSYQQRSAVQIPTEKRVPKPEKPEPCKVEIIKQSTLDFGYKKVQPGEVLTYEKFLEEQKKRGTRPASCQTSLKSSFKDVPRGETKGNVNKTKTSAAAAKTMENKSAAAGDAVTKTKVAVKSKKNVKRGTGKTTSEVSLTKVTSKSSLTKNSNSAAATVKQPATKIKKTVSQNSVQNLANSGPAEPKRVKKKTKARPSSASSRQSSDSVRGHVPEGKQRNLEDRVKQSPVKEEVCTVSNDHETKQKLEPSTITNKTTKIPEQVTTKVSDTPKQPEIPNQVPETTDTSPSEGTGVNVSVFTRDNITVSPRDVVVSRTVNKEKMTILVTVPRTSEALFAKTKIGKVEISLADSQSSDCQSVSSKSSDASCVVSSGSKTAQKEEFKTITAGGNDQDDIKTNTKKFQEPVKTTSTLPRQTSSSDVKMMKNKTEEENLHSKLEVVDSGYRSSGSPVNLLDMKRKPVSVERSSSRTSNDKLTTKTKTRSSRNSAASSKKSSVSRKVSLQSDNTLRSPSKPSPYDVGHIVMDATSGKSPNNRPSARSSARVAREMTEQSPYGSYVRYRVSQDSSRKILATQSQISQRGVASESQVGRKKTPRQTSMRRRIEEYSSRVSLQRAVNAIKNKEAGSSSLPSIYKERRIVSHFNSDLALNRNRMLIGT